MSTLVITVALIVGVVLAIPYLLWAQRQPDAGMRLYAIGLGVTAVLYLLFAVIGGAGGHSIGLESLGVLIYGGAALLGLRKAPTVLALGWAMHPVWDVALHLNGAGAAYTPDGYPWGCISFDLFVGGAVLTAAWARSR